VYHGPQVYWDNDHVRLTVMAVLFALLGVFSFVGIRAGFWLKQGDAVLDERDRSILAGASAGQSGAILITLAAWQIGLAEAFHGTHQVPMVFLYLIFWSCLVMTLLAWLAGIVLGYKRS
jgi:hypothetical protein